jgi:hypothetical protein
MKVLVRFLSMLVTALVCFACPQPTTKDCLPPQKVTVTNITDSSAVVNWTPVAGISTYELRLFKLVDTVYQEVSNQLVADTTKTLTNLTPHTRYKVEVRSECSKGVFSKAASATFDIQTVIIDDVVFGRSSNCVGQPPLTARSYPNSNIPTTFPVTVTSGQVMRIKAKIGGTRVNFAIINRYTSSAASWSIAHDQCEKNNPTAANDQIITAQGAELNFIRGGKSFKLVFIKNSDVVQVTLAAGITARVEIYNQP